MRSFSVIAGLALALAVAPATSAPVLEQVSPSFVSYQYASDFYLAAGTGVGDYTAAVFAVDLLLPATGLSTSGCEASDFAGFTAGAIALIQRGTCNFGLKAENALAAGAVAVILFNDGFANGDDAVKVTLGHEMPTLPVVFASFPVGSAFSAGITTGNTFTTAHIKVTGEDIAAQTVPEPNSLALAFIALGALGLLNRRGAARSFRRLLSVVLLFVGAPLSAAPVLEVSANGILMGATNLVVGGST